MARYTGPACRLCRREGEKLFLKGERCFSTRCAVERREGHPGEHARARGRFSEYRQQLREKQKVKRIYGILEKQFRAIFKEADRLKGVTGVNLLQGLERRLDNAVYRAGFGSSRRQSRQFVKHGHFLVNGKRVNCPSFKLNPGDVIAVREKSKELARIAEAIAANEARPMPEWIDLNKATLEATFKALPERSQLTQPMNEQLIVELYSK